MPLKRKTSSSQLSKLELGGKYNFDRMTYPSTGLASDTIPNYVIFYINVPESAQYQKTIVNADNSDISTSQSLRNRAFRPTITNPEGVGENAAIAASLVAVSALSGDDLKTMATQAIVGTVISNFSSDIIKRPKLNRIEKAIALYMPDTLVQTYGHDYDAVSATEALGNLGIAQRGATALTAGASAFKTAYDNSKFESFSGAAQSVANIASATGQGFYQTAAGKEAIGRIAEKTGVVNQGFADLMLKAQGFAVNPQIEMVYKQTKNRSFIFDFRMQPRSSKESRNIKNIIREFKRYAAPSIKSGGSNAAYYAIPAQFDIQFMFKNIENRFIGKISTCVLENIDVNYSSAGPFATFEDGSPVEIALQLRFVEVDILTKEAFEDDAGGVNFEANDGASF